MDEIINMMKLGFIVYGYFLAFSLLFIATLLNDQIPSNADNCEFHEDPNVNKFLGCLYLVSFLLLTFLPYLL